MRTCILETDPEAIQALQLHLSDCGLEPASVYFSWQELAEAPASFDLVMAGMCFDPDALSDDDAEAMLCGSMVIYLEGCQHNHPLSCQNRVIGSVSKPGLDLELPGLLRKARCSRQKELNDLLMSFHSSLPVPAGPLLAVYLQDSLIYADYKDASLLLNETSLDDILCRLPKQFIRLSDQASVNLRAVARLNIRDHVLEMSNGKRFSVSRRRWKAVVDAFHHWNVGC